MLGLFAKKSEHRDIFKEAFDFELPPYRQQESKLPDVDGLWTQLDVNAAEPVHLLVELNHFLHELNRTHISGDKRYNITTKCLDYASPAIRQLFFENQKGKALPENQSKREALTAAVKSVREFASSYKRIIKNQYKISDKEFKSPSRRLRKCMVTILEMIHAEQRLKALRYQKLSEGSWRDCNNIFFILHAIGETNKPFKPLGLNVSRSSPGESMAKSLKTNAEGLYVLIQLFGLIDPNSLSLQQAVIVENYLKQFLPQMHFQALNEEREEHEERMPMNRVVTAYGRAGPPLLSEDADVSGHILVMDINPLATGLQRDYQRLLPQLNGAKNDFDPKHDGEIPTNTVAIHRFEGIEQLLALHAMLKKLKEAARTDTRKYMDETQAVYVYNGFTAGFHMLNATKASTNADINAPNPMPNQLNIDLAQRSASLADGAQEDKLTQWEIINISACGMLLHTKETQYIKNLFVGQLMVFAESKAALSHPSCGWVVRICRDGDNNVEISLKILAAQIESVVVQTEILQKNAMGMPGIMIFDAGEDLQLLMHQSHRLLPGSNVTIQRSGNAYNYTIGKIEFFQREFVVYQLL
ncbi:MAG: hypothetical protein PVF82_14580 [Gammaproteobacteria bacterium]